MHIPILVILLTLLIPANSLSVNQVFASTLSVNAPLEINESTDVIMDVDLVISSPTVGTPMPVTPIVAGAGFGASSNAELRFIGAKSVIIASTLYTNTTPQTIGFTTWDLSSFAGANKSVRFSGSAELLMEHGSILFCGTAGLNLFFDGTASHTHRPPSTTADGD